MVRYRILKLLLQNGVQSLIDMEAEDFDDWGDDENQDIMNMVNIELTKFGDLIFSACES